VAWEGAVPLRDNAGGVIAILIGVFLAAAPTAVLFLGVTFLFGA
jgi:hypothetical protein